MNTYRFAMVLALAAAFFMVWMALGVGILGDPGDLADLMYVGVIAVGLIGALVARFRATGMTRALLAAALAQIIVALVVLVTGLQEGPSAGTMLILHAVFVGLFLGSSRLFRKAAGERRE
ncbi:MAG: hypothetical protein HKN93_00865 [Acidimicrobiia bacterium]|nr:hypothetical protein [Acidimicrobiia bacterium]